MKRALYVILSSILVISLALFLIFGLGDFTAPDASTIPNEDPTNTPLPEPARPEVNFSELPFFPYPALLENLPPENRQAVIVLGRGSHGNLWVAEKSAGRYYVLAGPFYCRLGKEGLTGQKTDNDGKTPLGTYNIGTLYGVSQPRGINLPFTKLETGDVWVTDIYSVYYNQLYQPSAGDQDFTDYRAMARNKNSLYLDIGYNALRVPGEGAFVLLANSGNTSIPTEGEIHLSTTDMLRTVQALEADKNPTFSIYLAEETDWQIEPSMAPGFTFLEDLPALIGNPVYTVNNNWLGRILPGYFGKHVVLSNILEENLEDVQRALRSKRLGLMVFDGYRPERAGQALHSYFSERQPPADTAQTTASLTLLQEANQMHSYGLALDVTLFSQADGQPLDLGGPYDYTSPTAAFNAPGLSEEQQNNRQTLREAMEAAGFTASDAAWWHFELHGALQIQSAYDFLIPQ